MNEYHYFKEETVPFAIGAVVAIVAVISPLNWFWVFVITATVFSLSFMISRSWVNAAFRKRWGVSQDEAFELLKKRKATNEHEK